MYQKYMYNGPVMYYDKVLSNNWTGITVAESEAKAVSNFKYQFKNQSSMVPTVGGVTLSGKVSCSTR